MAQTQVQPGQVALSGVVRSVRKFLDSYGEHRHATLLAVQGGTGARGMYEVFSGDPLARVGDQITCICSVSGVPHSYTTGEGAERRRVQTARHYLNVVGLA